MKKRNQLQKSLFTLTLSASLLHVFCHLNKLFLCLCKSIAEFTYFCNRKLRLLKVARGQNFKNRTFEVVANFDNELSLKYVIELRSLLILATNLAMRVSHKSYLLLILATTSEKIGNK